MILFPAFLHSNPNLFHLTNLFTLLTLNPCALLYSFSTRVHDALLLLASHLATFIIVRSVHRFVVVSFDVDLFDSVSSMLPLGKELFVRIVTNWSP